MGKISFIESNLENPNLLLKIGGVLIKLKREFRKRTTLVEIICALLIILFIYTGLNKLLDYKTFEFQLGRSPFIQDFAEFISLFLPAFELIIATLLIIKKLRIFGLYGSFFLMALFTIYIYAMLHYSPYVPCSCGGILESMSWNEHLIFNILFVILTTIGVLLQTNTLLKNGKN
jgi:hypothetical protein